MSHVPSLPYATSLTGVQLDAYLARIGVRQPVSRDLAGLTQLQRAHLRAFTWEAMDAFMGWPSSVAPAAAFNKMVWNRRGGWCYEMNGLFGAALAALGFRVTRLCGGVQRAVLGDLAIGNHLTLRVDLDRPYLVEVGLADALAEPMPLAIGTVRQRGFEFSISASGDGWLRFTNHVHGIAPSFDFRPDHSDEAALVATQGWLMQDPGSPFTQSLAIVRHTPEGYVTLQNDCLRTVTPSGVHEKRIAGAVHLADVFETVFDLEVPEPGQVWEKIHGTACRKAA